jgi:hypothetical protein
VHLGGEGWMVQASSSIGQTGSDVIRFKVRIVAEDFLSALTCCQKPEHVDNADSHPADTRPATTLVGIGGDSIQKVSHRSLHLHVWAYRTRSHASATTTIASTATTIQPGCVLTVDFLQRAPFETPPEEGGSSGRAGKIELQPVKNCNERSARPMTGDQ